MYIFYHGHDANQGIDKQVAAVSFMWLPEDCHLASHYGLSATTFELMLGENDQSP